MLGARTIDKVDSGASFLMEHQMKSFLLTTMIITFSAAGSVAQPLWDDLSSRGALGAGGATAGCTHRVELAAIDQDGDLDLIFANGGAYSTPGDPELNGALISCVSGKTSATDAFFINEDAVPARDIRMSWDIELVEVDNNFELDITRRKQARSLECSPHQRRKR